MDRPIRLFHVPALMQPQFSRWHNGSSFSSLAAVTLVHNDEVKEITLKERGKAGNGVLCRHLFLHGFISGELLVERKIDLVRGDRDRVGFLGLFRDTNVPFRWI